MAFAFDIAQVLLHVGARSEKSPQRLVVVSRATRAVGDPMTDRNWYSVRAIGADGCVQSDLIDCCEEELDKHPNP